MKTSWIASVMLALVLVTGCATHPGTTQSFTAALAAGPDIVSSGTGSGAFTFDAATGVLTYSVRYQGLSGPATMAHIHGPADPGANAGVVIPFANPASPITGTATLNAAQAADLQAGRYYVNVHTAANRGGEIRGQIILSH